MYMLILKRMQLKRQPENLKISKAEFEKKKITLQRIKNNLTKIMDKKINTIIDLLFIEFNIHIILYHLVHTFVTVYFWFFNITLNSIMLEIWNILWIKIYLIELIILKNETKKLCIFFYFDAKMKIRFIIRSLWHLSFTYQMLRPYSESSDVGCGEYLDGWPSGALIYCWNIIN